MNLVNEYFNMLAVVLILISVTLPFLENYIQSRNRKIKAECLLIANSHQWVSIEEIAGLVGISTGAAIKHIKWGIKERVIIGNLENNMFERFHERAHDEVAFSIPYEQDDS